MNLIRKIVVLTSTLLVTLLVSLPGTAANTASDRNNYRTTIGAGNQWSCAIQADKQVACWGYRQTGGSVPGLIGVSDAVSLSVAGHEACAATNSGKVYCWAITTPPTEIVGINSAVAVLVDVNQSYCALLNNGKINCWGNNLNGQLGDGTLTSRTTPIEVLNVTGAVSLASSSMTKVCAVTYAGGVYCWGNGTATPQAVQGAEKIRQIALSLEKVCLLNSSGQVFCATQSDSLNFANYSQVLNLTNAKLISGSYLSGGICVTDSNVAVKCAYLQSGGPLSANTGYLTTLRGDALQLDLGENSHTCAMDSAQKVMCMHHGATFNCDITLSGAACLDAQYINLQQELGLSSDQTAYPGTWYPVKGGFIGYKSGKPYMFTAPVAVIRDSRTSTSLTLSWDRGHPGSTGFDVSYRVANTTNWTAASDIDTSGTRPKVVISNLTPNTAYEIRVRGKTWASYTSYSPTYTTSTSP